jgi:GTP pyrophosphokinase
MTSSDSNTGLAEREPEVPVKPTRMLTIQQLLKPVKSVFSQAEKEMLKRAYDLGKEAHKKQKRASGEPYFSHCVSVAKHLLEICPEPQIVAAGLLHDVIEDTPISLDDLRDEFPPAVGELVDGVTKLNRVGGMTAGERKSESLRKMVLAMARDVRVIIIKLSDRLHNMQTLEALDTTKQIKIARETLEVYAPLAHMLGMAQLRAILEDLSMRILYTKEYNWIRQNIDKKREHREEIIKRTCIFTQKNLDARDIKAEVLGRSKHFYSIFQKIEKDQKSFDEIYDLLAIRIITQDIKSCYDVLGVIHSIFKPVPGRLKDYVGTPKGNGYQSIHTSVVDNYGERIEVQIRTEKMHKVAEEGVAAHWKYKLGEFNNTSLDLYLRGWRRAVESLTELHGHEMEGHLREDVVGAAVFCFTPAGEVVELPKGSTALDFAYHIHSKVGDTTVGAKANKKMVKLSYELQTGDTIEIQTAKSAHPSPSWLDFAKTNKAKSRIRRWLRSEKFDMNVSIGRDKLLKRLKSQKLNVDLQNIDTIMNDVVANMPFNAPEDLYAEIGFGSYDIDRILQRLKQQERSEKRRAAQNKARSDEQAVVVDGLEHTVVRFAGCCRPSIGDPIGGFITSGRGVTVHRMNCKNYQRIVADSRPEVSGRVVHCHWRGRQDQKHRMAIRILCTDRMGILADITNLFSEHHIFIANSNSSSRDAETAVMRFVVLVDNQAMVDEFIKVAEQMEGVMRITSQAA